MTNRTIQRDDALDYMRGVAIGLVLLGHVLLKEMHTVGPVFRLLSDFHMPFFFVLCGWLSVRASQFGWAFWQKKARSLLLPMLTVGGTFALTTGCCHDFLTGDFHAGYWFLLSLFEIWVMFALMRTVCRWLRVRNPFLQAAVLLVPFFVSKVAMPWVPDGVQHALTLSMTTAHYRWFVLGHFLGGHARLRRLLDHEAVRGTGTVVFLLLLLAYLTQAAWLDRVPLTALQLPLCVSFAILCLAAKDVTPCAISRYIQKWGGVRACISISSITSSSTLSTSRCSSHRAKASAWSSPCCWCSSSPPSVSPWDDCSEATATPPSSSWARKTSDKLAIFRQSQR